jgi:N-acetylmuramoyl-L-alanine amidase
VKFALRRILLALVLVAGGSSSVVVAGSARAANQVRDVHLWSGGESTRVVLQFAEAPRYRFFTLDRPRRAVLDIEQARLAPGRSLPAPAGLARGLRAAPRPDGALRLVVELPEGTAARALPVLADERNPHRLILDLGPGSASTSTPVPPSTEAPAATGAAGAEAAAAAAAPAASAPDATRAAGTPSATPAARVRAAHAPAASGRPVIVAVDAGHGGQDPGAIGRAGTREKDVVLEIAREVAARIDREPGMRAVLTRQGDHFLTLRQRIKRARDAKADMFVSIHADSIVDRAVSGASVYVLSEKGASDEQARWLAERENAADLKGGVSLDDKDGMLASVLLDLSNSANIASSMQAAERVLRSIDRVGEVRKPRVQQAGFVVLKSPDIPSMLVETAYISNAADERMLRQSERRARLAEAIFRGVHDYFQDHPPEGTRFALARRAPPPTAQAASPAGALR